MKKLVSFGLALLLAGSVFAADSTKTASRTLTSYGAQKWFVEFSIDSIDTERISVDFAQDYLGGNDGDIFEDAGIYIKATSDESVKVTYELYGAPGSGRTLAQVPAPGFTVTTIAGSTQAVMDTVRLSVAKLPYLSLRARGTSGNATGVTCSTWVFLRKPK